MSGRLRRVVAIHVSPPVPITEIPDDELVQRMRQGDTAALEALYGRYARVVFSFSLRIVGDGQTAEEILQEAFVRAWRQASAFQSVRGSFASWLLSITHNLAIDEMRRRQRRPKRVDGIDISDVTYGLIDEATNVEEAAEALIIRDRVLQALATLPDAQRVAVELAFYSGLSQREIAAALHEPLGTIKTRLRLGMQKLKIALATEWDGIVPGDDHLHD